ncbi:hypothetical protein ADK92_08130 [Streptomyces sp. XY533]|nr:hypothetical protein ADK92_08130 [Streptomyces sp. XY533]
MRWAAASLCGGLPPAVRRGGREGEGWVIRRGSRTARHPAQTSERACHQGRPASLGWGGGFGIGFFQ